MNEDTDSNNDRHKHSIGKWAQISKDYEKQGSVISAGFASKLDSITRDYQKLRTVSKKPKTFYIGADVEHRPSNIYLKKLEHNRREAELEAQAEEIQKEVRRQRKAEARQKKREEAEKLKKVQDAELAKAIAEERQREEGSSGRSAFKAYGGDRFGTRGDYSDGMLYLSRITASVGGANGKLKHISMKDGLFSHMRSMHEEHRRALLLQEHRAGSDDHHLMHDHDENASVASSDAFSDLDSNMSGDDIGIVVLDDIEDAFALGQNIESKRKCARALASMSQNPAICESVVRGGAIAAVVRLANVPDEQIRLDCARSMCTLSALPKNHEKMFDDDAISSLCKLLGSSIHETTYVTAITLANLAQVPGRESDIIASGVLAELSAIRHHHPATVPEFARLLVHLCSGNESINGLHEIVESIFTLANAHDEHIRELCLQAITKLVMVPSNCLLLASCGTTRLLADMLRFNDDDSSLRTYCVVIFALSCNEKSLSKLVEHGTIDLALDLAIRCGITGTNDIWSASYAVGALANMGRYELCLESMFDRGVVRAMVTNCTMSSEKLGEHASAMRHSCARVLHSMVNNESNATRAVKEGAMRALVGLCLPKDKKNEGNEGKEGKQDDNNEENSEESNEEVRRSSGLALAKLLARCNTASIPMDQLSPGTTTLIQLMTSLAAEEEAAENDPTHPKHVQALEGELDAEMTSACADAICNLAAQHECRGMLVAQGAVQTLTFLVKSGSEATIDKCAQALYFFSAQKENHEGMFEGGVVETAISVMKHMPGPKVVELCGAMLFTLAGDVDARSKILSFDGALDELLKMSMSKNQDVRILCGAVLCRLSNDINKSEQIIKAGAVPALMRLAHWTHHATRQRCIVAISNLARGKLRARIIDEGAVPVLIALSSSKDKKMRQDCAAALCNMSCSGVGGSELKMAEQGAIAALIVLGLVRSADEPVTRKTCAQGIFNLLSQPKNIKRAIGEDTLWALNEVADMDQDTQEMLAVAACNLSRDGRGRAKLLAGPIQTLMRMVADKTCSSDVRIAAGLAIQNLTCSCSPAEVASIAKTPRLTICLASLATTVDDAMVKLSCAASLCAISLNPDCRTAFLQGGGVQAMTQLASVGSQQMNNFCSATLYALASGGGRHNAGGRMHDRKSQALARECVSCGAMPLIVQLSASKHLPTKEHCVRTLYMLSLVEENRADIVNQNGVRCVVAMCIIESATSPLIQGVCTRVLCLLSCKTDATVRSKMVQDGAVRVISYLAEVLHDRRVRKDCVLTLCNLSFATNSAQMTTDGATHTLCELCDHRSAITMERISIVFRNLASHQGNVRRMVGAGVVPTLVAIASKGSTETKIHCMIGLCLISFEPTVRLAMSEEGAIPAIMELSSYIGTRAAVHYCGMAISNIAAESKAQGFIVKAGAISTLMAWMDQASHGSSSKSNHSSKRKEQTEEELMHEARRRVNVPLVEQGELEALSERFDEPKVKFEERSLPWRKFHIQLRVSEPEPPPLPTIQRPVIVTRKSSRRRSSKNKKDKKGKKKEKNESKEEDTGGLLVRPPNPVDIENTKILNRARQKMDQAPTATKIGTPQEELVSELQRKDNGSWAQRNDVSISTTKKMHEENEEGASGSWAQNDAETDPSTGGFEALFENMRSGDHPLVASPLNENKPVVPETGSPVAETEPMSGSSRDFRTEQLSGPPSPYDPIIDDDEDSDVNNEVFTDFEATMQEVKRTTANSTFGFGSNDFFSHLDSLKLTERGLKTKSKEHR